MNTRLMKICCAGFCVLLLSACPSRIESVDADLSNPGALVLAGKNKDKIFLANRGEDNLQVVALGDSLSESSFVNGPIQFLPLRIPCGGQPEKLVASDDGDYVVFHDASHNTLGVVDAENYLLRLGFGASSSGFSFATWLEAPAALVAGEACSDCLVHFFVSLPKSQKILELKLLSEEVLSIELVRVWSIDSGYPEHLIYTENNILFASDQQAARVWEIDLGAPEEAPTAIDIASRAGALTWSEKSKTLFVARPAMEDVLAIDLSGDTPEILDLNARFAPTPECLLACEEETEPLCIQQHLADQALCVQAGGFDAPTEATPYTALFMASKTQSMVVVDGAASETTLAIECNDAQEEHETLLVSAGLDGSFRFASLDALADGGQASLVNTAWCEENTLTQLAGAELSAYLAPCLSAPSGRERFTCLQGDASDASGVLIMAGQSRSHKWSLIWEDIILSREHGGGVVAQDGSFYDIGVDLGAVSVTLKEQDDASSAGHLGDVLEILSEPRLEDEACSIEDYQGLCTLERRIVGQQEIAGRTHYILDQPLNPACFGLDGSVAYRLRAADHFGLYQDDNRIAYIQPGERFGPGGDVGHAAKTMFALQALAAQSSLEACARYESTGAASTAMDPVLSRNIVHQFQISEPFTPLEGAITYDYSGASLGPVGYLPAAMLLVKDHYTTPMIFVTYAGTNALFGFSPFDIKSINLARDSYFLAD